MNRFLLITIFALVLLSCEHRSERRILGKIDIHKHYLLHKLQGKQLSIDMEYSYQYVNDSIVLIKLYRLGDLTFKSFDFAQINDRKSKYDTLDYQKWYLCYNKSIRKNTRVYIFDSNIIEDNYFVLDSQREIYLEGEQFTILSFFIDHDEVDGDSRIFFNPKVGFLAEYSHSGFDARLCWETNDFKSNTLRKQLISKLIADTTFFPYPRELYSSPPITNNK